MKALDVLTIRSSLGVSRAELARFLGVSERTVTRWEGNGGAADPNGLQEVLLRAIVDAVERSRGVDVARLVRSSAVDHRRSIKAVLDAAG